MKKYMTQSARRYIQASLMGRRMVGLTEVSAFGQEHRKTS
jgi:hypothetical protein